MNPNAVPGGHIIDDGTMTADIYSTPVWMNGKTKCSFECTVSSGSSPSGVIKIQASNSASTWETLTLDDGSTGVTISADGTTLFDIETAFGYLRVWYDFTSGSGTLNVYATRA